MKADIDKAPSKTTQAFGALADDLREQVWWSGFSPGKFERGGSKSGGGSWGPPLGEQNMSFKC